MDSNNLHVGHHTEPSHRATQIQQGPLRSIDLPIHERQYEVVSGPNRSDYTRATPYPLSNPSYSVRSYVGQHSDSQLMPTVGTMPGLEVQYSSYLPNSGRLHQLIPSSNSGQISTNSSNSALPTMQQTSMFEPYTQYQHRHCGSLGPVTGQYFLSQYSSSEDSAVSTIANSTSYVPSQSDSTSYQSMSLCRPEPLPSTTTISGDYGRQPQSEPQISLEVVQDRQVSNDEWQQYEQNIRTAFEAIIVNKVNSACDKLLVATRWLLLSVTQLGLHLDNSNEGQHEDDDRRKLALWREFNHCWEALAQKQKMIVENQIRTQRRVADRLSIRRVKATVDEFISLCDPLEQYGLIDYERGVWEEQIVSVFIACLDLMEQDDGYHADRSIGDA